MSVTQDSPTFGVTTTAIPSPRAAIHDIGDTTDITDTVAPPTIPAAVDLCACGHERDAHEHYRPGTDCGVCGVACRAFHARTGRAAGRYAGSRPRLASALFRRS